MIIRNGIPIEFSGGELQVGDIVNHISVTSHPPTGTEPVLQLRVLEIHPPISPHGNPGPENALLLVDDATGQEYISSRKEVW